MRRLIPVIALLLATACQANQSPTKSNEAQLDNVSEDLQPGGNALAPSIPPTLDTPNPAVPPAPHMDPGGPTPPAEASALGAARRLQEYCDAIATQRYRDAYGYWSDGGEATGMTFAQFRDSFAKYRAYDCHIGDPGAMEGAAGSVYVTIPLKVTGALTRGGGFVLEGPVDMRRVNDVDGSTAEQRRWHIFRSGLKPRP